MGLISDRILRYSKTEAGHERYAKIKQFCISQDINFEKFLKAFYLYMNSTKSNTYFLTPERIEKRKKNYAQKYIRRKKKRRYYQGQHLGALVRQYFFRRKKYVFMFDAKIALYFKLVCIIENCNPSRLLEAFMNAFNIGDESIVPFMEQAEKFHDVYSHDTTVMKKRLERLNKIVKLYNLPEDWWIKFSDLKIEDVV